MAAIQMKRVGPASLLVGLALAAGASAGPIDDRGGAKSELETAYAPVPQAGSAEATEQSAPAASEREPGRGGGAGRQPSLDGSASSLNATRDRPLFSASRRPASLAVQTPPPPPARIPPPRAGKAGAEIDWNDRRPRDEPRHGRELGNASGEAPAGGGRGVGMATENGHAALDYRRKG